MTGTNILIARLLKSRQSKLKVGEYTFTVRRPTAYEAALLFQNDPTQYDVARDYVDDWDGIKDKDLIPSGGNELAEFDKTLWAEWLSDQPELWEPIFDHVVKSYQSYKGKVDDEGKD